MKTTFILIGALLITLISSFAWSSGEQQGEQEKDYSQSTHNAEWRQAKDDEDKKLNRTYQALMKILPSKEKKAQLVKAQRAWISYRDAACDFEQGGWAGTSSFDTFYSQCVIQKTKVRTLELEETLKEEQSFP